MKRGEGRRVDCRGTGLITVGWKVIRSPLSPLVRLLSPQAVWPETADRRQCTEVISTPMPRPLDNLRSVADDSNPDWRLDELRRPGAAERSTELELARLRREIARLIIELLPAHASQSKITEPLRPRVSAER